MFAILKPEAKRSSYMTKPTVLIICDGWGEMPPSKGNAITLAQTPRLNALREVWPHTTIEASGEAVGLPKGQMGNSEVGHLTIGAGRILMQPLQKQIHESASGELEHNAVIAGAINQTMARKSNLHVISLISEGNVHAYTGSTLALAKAAKNAGVPSMYVHVIADGRDTPPQSGKIMIQNFSDALKEIGLGQIASIGGRYYGMDRDNRWDRIEKTYDVMTNENSPAIDDIAQYFDKNYSKDNGDEFLIPVGVNDAGKRTVIQDNDVVVFMNFRPDRARQLSHALADTNFSDFKRTVSPKNLYFATLTEYDETLPAHVAYPRDNVTNSLAEVLSKANLRQYHVAETEKYAHVTYFLNGGQEVKFQGEDRSLIPSVKVATYDLQPEMSARAVADDTIDAIKSGDYDCIIVNFANADMVGHSGMLSATIQAIETLDACIADVIDATLSHGGAAIMTADHGNAEVELDENDNPVTSHTTSPVPMLVCGLENIELANGGSLADVAPTILEIMGLPKPDAMTGSSLLRKR